jgi:hypothetical protein
MEGNSGKVNPEVVNQALEKLARAFALAVKDVEFRKFIKAEVGKKFDGDYEFLYKFAREKRFIDGESFETKLGKGYSKVFKQGLNEGISRVKELVELIPKFNIAVPVNFEKWDDENYVPLVAYHPVGVDDKLVKKVKAFDSEGNEYWLDAWKAPDFPVIVLGVNERVDDNGNVRYFSLPNMRESEDDGGGGGSFGGGGSTQPRQWGCWEIFESLQVLDDQEPWTKGDPEIVLLVKAKNYPDGQYLFKTAPFSGFDFAWEGAGLPWEDDYTSWKTYNWDMFNWTQDIGEWVVYYWYEDDWDWSLTLKGEIIIQVIIFGVTIPFKFHANLTIGDSDDEYGYKVVYFSDPYQVYDLQGKLKWTVKWRNPTSS